MRIHSGQLYLLLGLAYISSFSSCGLLQNRAERPRAIEGVLDLTHYDFEERGPIRLAGEFEFYWHKHLVPDDFGADAPSPRPDGYMTLPGRWNDYRLDISELGAEGYATYRLTILLDSTHTQLALRVLDLATTFSVFANGEKLFKVGFPGTTKATTTPQYEPLLPKVIPAFDKIELIYQVSNFHHRIGGVWNSALLGNSEEVFRTAERKEHIDSFLIGSILIMALYHIAVVGLRKSDRSSMYFGLGSLCVAFRLLTSGERHLAHIFPAIPWEMFIAIEYASTFLIAPFFALFFYSLFPREFGKRAIIIIASIGFLFPLPVFFLPPRLYSHLPPFFHIFAVAGLTYALIFVVRLIRKRDHDGTWLLGAGLLILTITTIGDIVSTHALVFNDMVLPIGLFAFILAYAYYLSLRYSKAFTIIDQQRAELEKTNLERDKAEQENFALQEQVMRLQKMEAIGLLAGGVAHDLNNILTGIVTLPDVLLYDLSPDNPLKKPLMTIRDSGQKASLIVQDLLTLGRRGAMQKEVLNLNKVIAGYLRSPEHLEIQRRHTGITTQTNLEPSLLNIKGSSVHLTKAIMNLVSNAAESQPAGGRIGIKTRNRHVDRPQPLYELVDAGDYVVVSVEDEGEGIKPEDQKKVFEPFYTKKVMGRRSGSGLGMAVVWGTAHDHDGYVNLASRPDKGTTVELYFPVSSEELIHHNDSLPIQNLIGKGERILVVDDVVEQREIASGLLDRLGYQAETAESGEAAVEYVKENSVDLIILDMIMEPGIDGYETYRRIAEIVPGVKVIIASGFSETDRVKKAQALGAGPYIKKPYTLETIAKTVKDLLD